MADKKITELNQITTIDPTDIFPVVDNPSGSPETKKSTFQQLADWLASLSQNLTNKTLQGNNNVSVVSQKDSNGTERSIAKINASNILEIGDSNLAGQQFNTPLVNNTAIKQKDSTGTARNILNLNSSNDLEIGGDGINKLIFKTPFDGWIAANETWTYASSTSFTVSGNVTGKYQKGDKIKLTQSSTVKYFYIIGVSYSAPNTTITITGGSDYSLANAPITDNYYSKVENPQGFPDYFNYNSTVSGTGGSEGTYSEINYASQFTIKGRTVYLMIYKDINNIGSWSGTLRVLLPVSPSSNNQIVIGLIARKSSGNWHDANTWGAAYTSNNYLIFNKNYGLSDVGFADIVNGTRIAINGFYYI